MPAPINNTSWAGSALLDHVSQDTQMWVFLPPPPPPPEKYVFGFVGFLSVERIFSWGRYLFEEIFFPIFVYKRELQAPFAPILRRVWLLLVGNCISWADRQRVDWWDKFPWGGGWEKGARMKREETWKFPCSEVSQCSNHWPRHVLKKMLES